MDQLATNETNAASVAEAPAAQLPLELSIIVPTFNEQANIERLVELLTGVLDGIGWEVIFVDDDSKDGTGDVIAELARKNRQVRGIYRRGKRGLATAVIDGALASSAPVVAVMDADLQHDESLLPSLFLSVRNGAADIAIGSRYVEGGSVGEWDELRHSGSQLATRLATLIAGRDIKDPMSGFFAMRREVFFNAQPKLSSVGFKILLDIVSSSPSDLKIIELPFSFRGRESGESKMSFKVVADYLMMIVDKTIGRFIPTRFILFMMVGALGLVVHLSVLGSVLAIAPERFALAQTLAVIIAIAFNFTLNNSFTYRDLQLRGWRFLVGLASFYLVCSVGALANVGVGTLVYQYRDIWWLAGAAGALTGAVWNFSASSILTWKKK